MFKSRRSLPLLDQFSRYVVVGGIAFSADIGVLYILTEYFGWHYLVAATGSFLVGLGVNYLLCVMWIFHFRTLENRLHEFVVFGLIGITGLALNNLILAALTGGLNIHYLLSKVVSAGIILVFNFGLRRWFLFTPRAAKPTSLN